MIFNLNHALIPDVHKLYYLDKIFKGVGMVVPKIRETRCSMQVTKAA